MKGWVFAAWAALFYVGQAGAVSRIVYMQETDSDRQIWIAELDGKNAKPLTKGSAWSLYPEIDAAGTKVVYVEASSETASRLVAVDIMSGQKAFLTEADGRYLHPDLSGSGKALAYSGPDQRITILTVDPKTLKPIGEPEKIETSYPSYFPALSSDAGFVIYQRNTSDKAKEIVLYDRASKKEKKVSPDEIVTMSPSLSFDDRYVAFTGFVDGNWEVYVKDLYEGGETVRVTNDKAKDLSPTFRADGSLVFASDREGGMLQFYVVAPESLRDKTFKAAPYLKGAGNLYAPSFSGESRVAQAKLPDIPAPARSSFGAVVVNGKVYVVGGHQGAEHTYPPESFLDRVDVYDPKENAWTTVKPRPRQAHGFGLAAYGKYLYAFGGFAYSHKHLPKWRSLDEVDRYDTETGEWKTVATLPRRRSSNVVAVVGTKAYLIAGWDSTPKFDKDFDGVFHREIDVFDLEKETVSTLAETVPNPLRRALTGVVAGKKIILIGGITEGAMHFNLIDNVTSFDTETGKFEEMPRLPFATFAPAAGFLDNRLWVFGGMFRVSKEEFVYVNHIYSLDKKGWGNIGRFLHESKGFSQVVNLDTGELGILGGHSYEGNNAPVGTFETFGLSRP